MDTFATFMMVMSIVGWPLIYLAIEYDIKQGKLVSNGCGRLRAPR